MSELISFIASFIGRGLSQCLLGPIVFWIGWPFAKLMTLGHYPKRCWQESSSESTWVSCLGVVVFVLFLMLLLGQLTAIW